MDAQGAKQERGVAFGKYELIAKLATGGMGEIFLARLSGMAGFEKLVVIKRLLPHLAEDSHFVAMLLDEARIAARLSHPNVCQVYDLGEVDGQYYIAMEYLEGVPISQMLQRARREKDLLDVRMATAFLSQSCEGLHHAHELKDRQGEPIGLVHRDVSPSNLFVTSAGVVKVLDFGVAKSQDALARTHTGALKGKYAYMSPEQVLTNPVDRRSDIFSLGIVLFELLTARRLFWRDSEYKMFQAIAEDEIPTVSRFRPEVPEAVSRVVERALSRDADARYSTAKHLAEDLAKAVAPLGGFATAAAVADYVADNFDSQIQERRELVQTAVSSSSAPRTAPTRAAKLRPHKPVELRGQPRDDAGDSPTVSDTGRARAEPLGIDQTADMEALATGSGGWKLVVGVLVGILVAGGVAFAYVKMREKPPKPTDPPIVVVNKGGDVEPEDGTTIEKETGAPDESAPPDAEAVVSPDAGADEPDEPDEPPTPPPTKLVPPPKVRKGETAQQVMTKAQKSWRACVKRNPYQTASPLEVKVTITIGKNGSVSKATVKPAGVRNAPVGKCMHRIAKNLRFRSADGGTTLTQSMELTPTKRPN